MTGPIVIVEDRAHEPTGHFPLVFASLATQFQQLGLNVITVTSRGWALEGDTGFTGISPQRFGPIAAATWSFGSWLDQATRNRMALAVRDVCWSTAVIASARRVSRQVDASGVVLVSRNVHPLLVALLADDRPWAAFRFDHPSGWMEQDAFRPLLNLVRRAERRRERRGGRVRVIVNNTHALARWSRLAPWLAPSQVFFTFSTIEPKPTARSDLGLDAHERLALLFGAPHGGKDLVTVFDAFADLDGWRLVIAGAGSSSAYRDWAATRTGPVRDPILFDGYVDMDTRAKLFSTVDAVVLSFQKVHDQDSGTFVDAISAGTPVVYSDGPDTEVVRRFRLGETFRAGDPQSLCSALRRIQPLDEQDVAAARSAMSPRRSAEQVLEQLALVPALGF